MAAPRALRADARRNRDGILAAAGAAFAEHGLDTSLDDIARRAGVGSGTLYRHFPTRGDLVAAVFLRRMAEHVCAVEAALEHEDAWAGLVGHVDRLCRAQAADRGFADLMAIGYRGRELRELRVRAYDGLAALIARAQACGTLRADLSLEDVVLLLMANAGVVDRCGDVAAPASERFVSLALDGFRAAGATPAPPPVSPRALMAAVRARQRDR